MLWFLLVLLESTCSKAVLVLFLCTIFRRKPILSMQFVLENFISWMFPGAALKLDWKISCGVEGKGD